MTESNLIASNLRSIMEHKEITISQLANMSQIPEDTIKSIRSGRTKNPGIQTIIRLADAFQCSIDQLIGRNISLPEEARFLEKWKNLGNHGKNLIEVIIDLECANAASPQKTVTCIVPLGYFGDGISYNNFTLEQIEISEKLYKQADFCIRITTNTMVPLYFYGDTIAIEKRFPNSGEIGIFIHNNIGYIRKYSIENSNVQLLPLFPACKDLTIITLEDYVCIGTVLGAVN